MHGKANIIVKNYIAKILTDRSRKANPAFGVA